MQQDSTMTLADLQGFRLSEQEWGHLQQMPFGDYDATLIPRVVIDMAVLNGLALRMEDGTPALTDLGEDAVRLMNGMEPGDRRAAYWAGGEDTAGEPPSAPEPPVEASPPSHTTVGSLVRHKPSGAVGIVTEHSMWDGDWGAFRTMFARPARIGRAMVTTLVDRADRWEKVA